MIGIAAIALHGLQLGAYGNREEQLARLFGLLCIRNVLPPSVLCPMLFDLHFVPVLARPFCLHRSRCV